MEAKKGRLRFDDFGYSMPVSEPLFKRPPFGHRALERLNITFETEYESAAGILPDLLRFSEETPLATLMVAYFKNAAVAGYLEAILMLHCEYEGRKMLYMPSPLVTVIGPMLTGRELWGYPKRPAQIEFERGDAEARAVVRRPNGAEVLTASVRIGERMAASEWENKDGCFVKMIPGVAENAPPDVCQLVGARGELTPVEENGKTALWRGTGRITWGAASENDPWRAVPVGRVVKASFGVFDSTLGYGYVLHDYLK